MGSFASSSLPHSNFSAHHTRGHADDTFLLQATHAFVANPSKLMTPRAYELLFIEYFNLLSAADQFMVASLLAGSEHPTTHVRRALVLSDMAVALVGLNAPNWLEESICLDVLSAGPDLKRRLILDHQTVTKPIIRWVTERGHAEIFQHLLASRNVLFSPATQKIIAARAASQEKTTNLFLSRGDCNAEVLLPLLNQRPRNARVARQSQRLAKSLNLGVKVSAPLSASQRQAATGVGPEQPITEAAVKGQQRPQVAAGETESNTATAPVNPPVSGPQQSPLKVLDKRVKEANLLHQFVRSVSTRDRQAGMTAAAELLALNETEIATIFADPTGNLAMLMLGAMRMSSQERKLIATRMLKLSGVEPAAIEVAVASLNSGDIADHRQRLNEALGRVPAASTKPITHVAVDRQPVRPLTRQDVRASIRTLPNRANRLGNG